jgi:hypothetical protein
MGGMSGGGSQTVTTSIDPAMRPYITYGLDEAKRMYESGPLQFYPGQTNIGPSDMTQAGMQMAQQRALAGSPLISGAQNVVGNLQTAVNPAMGAFGDIYNRSGFNPAMGMTGQTASGAYLGGNPFFEGAFGAATRGAQTQFQDQIQQIASQASQAGRYGSGAMGGLQDRAMGQFAQALTDTAGNLAFQNYGQERGLQEAAMGRLGALSNQAIQNQLQAAGGLGQVAQSDFQRQLQAAAMSPDMAAQDYADMQRLIDLGQMQEGYQQAALADSMQRFNFEQTAPYQSLQSYLSAVYGAPMGGQTSQPIYRNPLGSGLSGAAAGAGIGSVVPGLGTGVGAAIGGGLGLLGGMI